MSWREILEGCDSKGELLTHNPQYPHKPFQISPGVVFDPGNADIADNACLGYQSEDLYLHERGAAVSASRAIERDNNQLNDELNNKGDARLNSPLGCNEEWVTQKGKEWLPTNYYKASHVDGINSDKGWIARKLRRVAIGRRLEIAKEYSQRYLAEINTEPIHYKKEDVARRIVNTWLREVTI